MLGTLQWMDQAMKPLYNEPRDYSRVWWPAVYVGEDSRLRGTHGKVTK